MSTGNKFCRLLYKLPRKIRAMGRKLFTEPIIKKSFAECGVDVHVPAKCSFSGISNIYVGNHVFFGAEARILTTRAKVIFGNYIMLGPGVTIITGDHRTDIVGRYMVDIKDSEKLPENDEDVVIEDDVWLGANAVILKGVTIGKGAIVASGALVTKNVPPYSIVGGVPAKLLKSRFTDEEIQEHENLMLGLKEQTK